MSNPFNNCMPGEQPLTVGDLRIIEHLTSILQKKYFYKDNQNNKNFITNIEFDYCEHGVHFYYENQRNELFYSFGIDDDDVNVLDYDNLDKIVPNLFKTIPKVGPGTSGGKKSKKNRKRRTRKFFYKN